MTAWQPNKWSFMKHQQARFCVHVLKDDGYPAQISGATAIKLRITKADNTVLEKAAVDGMVWGNPLNQLYIYGFVLSSDELDSLPLTLDQTVELIVEFGSVCQYFVYNKALSVISPKI